jgi:hypothetical protein
MYNPHKALQLLSAEEVSFVLAVLSSGSQFRFRLLSAYHTLSST